MTTPPSTESPTITLNDGVEIPQLGFGVWQVPAELAAASVTHALEAGYRHIDTAAAYGNEAGVGEAVRHSGLARDGVFITTKLPNSDHGYERGKQALHQSLEQLGLDYVDLYLIHWPVPSKDLYVDCWRALIELRDEGLARSIGVSNFQQSHLQRIIDETEVTPSVDQVELHPYFQQTALKAEVSRRGIHIEAWSPLAQGELVDDPVLTEIGAAHEKTASQVALRWHLQRGNIIFPKSVTPSRIRENFQVFDFDLSDDELRRIDGLDQKRRLGGDPDTFAEQPLNR
jgi:2,5-diketo-D-gluconate reductase A